MKVTPPTVHVNGSCPIALRDEYMTASMAISNAIVQLANATLNSRDYYLQPPGAYYIARAERDTAFDHLRQALAYVDAMLSGICDQIES